MNGRELFEKIYNDEMDIPDSHVFGDAQELDFEDASVREAAYAGFVLAMNATQEHLSNARQAMKQLKATMIGPLNSALLSLEDEQQALSNFRFQLNKHNARRMPKPELTVESLYNHEAVVEVTIRTVERVTAPSFSRSRIPKHTLEACEHFHVGVAMDFDKFYPVGYKFGKLVMANGVGPAGKEYQQNVFIVLELKGDPVLYPMDYAESLKVAYNALVEIEAHCQNICAVGHVQTLGEAGVDGGPVKALCLALCIHHHEFQKAQIK